MQRTTFSLQNIYFQNYSFHWHITQENNNSKACSGLILSQAYQCDWIFYGMHYSEQLQHTYHRVVSCSKSHNRVSWTEDIRHMFGLSAMPLFHAVCCPTAWSIARYQACGECREDGHGEDEQRRCRHLLLKRPRAAMIRGIDACRITDSALMPYNDNFPILRKLKDWLIDRVGFNVRLNTL